MIYRSFVVPRWQADNAALKAEIKDEKADKTDALQTLQTVSEGPGCPTRTHSCSGSILTCVQQTEMDGILMGYDGRLYPDAFLRPF